MLPLVVGVVCCALGLWAYQAASAMKIIPDHVRRLSNMVITSA